MFAFLWWWAERTDRYYIQKEKDMNEGKI